MRVNVLALVCLCILGMPVEARRCLFPGVEVAGHGELPYGRWELNLCLLEELPVFLIAELGLQPLCMNFKRSKMGIFIAIHG